MQLAGMRNKTATPACRAGVAVGAVLDLSRSVHASAVSLATSAMTTMPRHSSLIRHDGKGGSGRTRVEMAGRGTIGRWRNPRTAAPLANQDLGRKETNGEESQTDDRVD